MPIKGAVASLRINAVEMEWTDDSRRKPLPCRGECAKPTTGRMSVRNVLRGTNHFDPWCLLCAMRDAIARGVELD